MLIDKRTRTADVLPLLDEKRMTFVLDRIPAKPLKKKVLDMTVGEYIEALDEGYAMRFLKKRRAFVALGLLKQFRKEMEEVARWMEAHSLPAEPADQAAMAGCDFPTAQEAILIETREAFGLQRLDSAGKFAKFLGNYGASDIPLAEYLLTMKAKVAGAQFDKNRNAQQQANMHSQIRRRAR